MSAHAQKWPDPAANVEITGVSVEPYTLARSQALQTSQVSTQTRSGWMVRISGTQGLIGLGDIAPWPGFGADAQTLAPQLDELARRIPPALSLGQLPDFDRQLSTLAAPIRHGLTTALLDLLAQAKNLPLANMLGPAPAREVSTATVIDTVEQAIAAVRAGFTCLKLKLGVADPGDDLDRVGAIRKACPRTQLRVDVNGGWTHSLAADMCQRLAVHGLAWIEQPLPANDLEGMAKLQANSPVKLALDETLACPERRLMAETMGLGDVWVLKPSAIGGLLATLDVHATARAAGRQTCISFAWTSAIGQRAAVCLAANVGNNRIHGLASPWTTDVAPALATTSRGTLLVPQTPGLGLGEVP